MLEARCEEDCEIRRTRLYLERTATARGLDHFAPIDCDHEAWKASGAVPMQVGDSMVRLGLPAIESVRWCSLTDLQRFALLKLTRAGHTRSLETAVREFDLLAPQG